MRNLDPKLANREVAMAAQGGNDDLCHTSPFILSALPPVPMNLHPCVVKKSAPPS